MEEEITGIAIHGSRLGCFQPFALEEMAWFVDLWEGQCYLWDPADNDLINMWAHGTVMASMAEAFGGEWTIVCMCHVWTYAHMSLYSLHDDIWAEACISLISQLRNKVLFIKLSTPCSAMYKFVWHSVQKRSIVHWTVWTMFGKLTVHSVKNRLYSYFQVRTVHLVSSSA